MCAVFSKQQKICISHVCCALSLSCDLIGWEGTHPLWWLLGDEGFSFLAYHLLLSSGVPLPISPNP